MKTNDTIIGEATQQIEHHCYINPTSESTRVFTKIIVGLYAVRLEKFNFNIHDMFLLDNQNFKNLNVVLNYLYETNKAPCQIFEQSFIDNLRIEFNK
jgi:hypothetical protein